MEKGKLAKHNSCSGVFTFSEDIITEIFLWLPLNSLVRFKRLSKRWYFLISHKHSNFRFKYLSTLSTRKTNRIVGSSHHQSDAIMAGFFYQRRLEYKRTCDRVRFLPYTQFKKYDDIPQEQEPINPFSSLDESLHKLLSCCVYQDQDQKISIVGSSNGFLLCRSRQIYYLVNPVTMEWVALPKFKDIRSSIRAVYVGFVCTGDYPSLDLVEYTVAVVSWAPFGGELFLKFFSSSSSGDNQWTEYTWSCWTVQPFDCRRKQNVVIVRSSTSIINSDDHEQGGGGIGIVVYFVVKLLKVMTTAIVVFDLNKGKSPGDDNLLQVIETPEPNRGNFRAYDCDDYIREFDGVIHYVRILSCSKDFEFWVLNTESRDWCLKHKVSLKKMMEGYYLWSTDVRLWNGAGVRQVNEAVILYQIHAFHPMNPNLIFLTLYGRMVCYNLQTGMLELVYDFSTRNMLDKYYHFVYQWPCWPPLF